jgi:hypothetical protein
MLILMRNAMDNDELSLKNIKRWMDVRECSK